MGNNVPAACTRLCAGRLSIGSKHQKSIPILSVIAIFIAATFLSQIAFAQLATVRTDKSEYGPGERVTITGSGWQAGEVVRLLIVRNPKTHDDVTLYSTANSLGAFTNTEFVIEQDDGGVTFTLTATGQSSGQTAQTTFRDANPSADLDQCANGPSGGVACTGTAWENGNLGPSKARYFEGDSIPYRLKFANLDTSIVHTVTIEWDTTKSGKHAIDYLTTWDRSAAAGSDACSGVSGCGSPTTFPIPIDPNVAAAGVTQISGVFTLYNGTITAVSAYTLIGTYAGDSSTRITITFTASTANPVLAWGGHIATRSDWGLNNSAVTIPGSPYHMRLIDLDGKGGNQDRSMSAEAVIFPASITITKQATPEGTTSFDFSSSDFGSFTLIDDGTNTSNSRSFNGIVTFKSYTFTETVPSSWSLDSIVCTVTSPNGGNGSGNTGTGTATINLKEGENWTCTFNDSKHCPGSCDDGNPCTTDTCDQSTNFNCVHTNNTLPCNDGNACTTNDTCSGGTCLGGPPPNCNDGNVCTNDSCDPASGCTHVNNTDPCNDGNACTTNDTCSGGACVGGAPPNCNDGNVCTTDTCNTQTGCVHTNNPNPCNDGNACTTADTCSGGMCVGGAPPNCDDGNVCTTDTC
ncbi:MAG TPA: hypothetical protein VGK31_04200, partial [Thermoanaerobaculia bacterium]